jgi:hypothetical protein
MAQSTSAFHGGVGPDDWYDLFTVSRLVSSWEGRGIVKTRRGGVTICDVPTLRAVAEDA